MPKKSFKDLALTPFTDGYFTAPDLNIPLSTIKIPSLFVCMLIVAISFVVIAGGTIFCWVQGIPFIYPRLNEKGQIETVVFMQELSYQTGCEGIIASSVYLFASLSLISACYVMQKKQTSDDDILYNCALVFGYTSPFWIICAIIVFRCKIPRYFPTPFI
ncbi:hypothetical protein TVAG_094030 [Trichomonas vaginalis G3]|uniref:Uncharacterized protein n=1 Tax=Trichomonas vaginalis (strain ATCC PRA-98 / G3) TaxID=412133 RepID=A2DBM5_TRIV3|nr:OST3 / OST6 family, transporter family [Trichomonas vaginalis G3]EAY22228.1 hypothetical protein TVAG_094030 [Trichomonas vaginalis G3]KAI5533314.1 OST3 / OST6 family, transporter family [Trichomonas vaginalis G3]|eukprot:XP_001583214.1 hypothetical protein [Trichomonas vaginalis G3]